MYLNIENAVAYTGKGLVFFNISYIYWDLKSVTFENP